MTKNRDWRSPESNDAKAELIGKAWGEEMDTYLFYEIGDVNRLTDEEQERIVKEFFPGGAAGFGDVELHRSSELKGHPMLLRLRGLLTLHPSLTLRGRVCPLYQIGYSDMLGSAASGDMINFHERWD